MKASRGAHSPRANHIGNRKRPKHKPITKAGE
jgi:hypothetical protein